MDPQKKADVLRGTMPNKPAAKRTRHVRRNVRKPLDYLSKNVPPVAAGIVNLNSPDKRPRSGPGYKVNGCYNVIFLTSLLVSCAMSFAMKRS